MNRKIILIYLILILFIIFSSCGRKMVKEEELKQRDNLRTEILKTFPTNFSIHIQSWTNNSKNPDLDYLDQAIPEMIGNYLKPIENENIFVPFETFTLQTTPAIENLLFISNSIFSNYVTNMDTEITQSTKQILTNNFVIISTNSSFTEIQDPKNKKKTIKKLNLFVETNNIVEIQTNVIITNLIETNMKFILPEQYALLITNEYTNITDTICYLPVVIFKDYKIVSNIAPSNSVTNIISSAVSNIPTAANAAGITNAASSTNAITNSNPTNLVITISTNLIINTNIVIITNNAMTPNYTTNTNITTNSGIVTNSAPPIILQQLYATINGDFDVIPMRSGPNIIKVNMFLQKITDSTNETNLSLQSREDNLSDNIYDFLKPIRYEVLNQTNGDIYIVTAPDKANIYLDGTFIGKSPLYYPVVPIGKHQITFFKEGYNQAYIQADIIENKTNIITKTINKQLTGGIVHIDSRPSNSSVFIDSNFYGNTPMIVTNLVIGSDHRIKIVALDDTNLFPYYKTIKLDETNQVYNINAHLTNFEGTPVNTKQIIWWSVFGSWGVTLGLTAYAIYSDYTANYYRDYYIANQDPNDYNQYNANLQNSQVFRNYAIAWGVLAALPLTAYALYNEEIYLGFQYLPNNNLRALIYIAF